MYSDFQKCLPTQQFSQDNVLKVICLGSSGLPVIIVQQNRNQSLSLMPDSPELFLKVQQIMYDFHKVIYEESSI